MSLEIGTVLEGKITGITKFGAFVALPEGKSGLVHISEISNSYVSDVSEHVSVGQTVKVLVKDITPDGKINLSIKRAEVSVSPARGTSEKRTAAARPVRSVDPQPQPEQSSGDKSFEDRLKKFMQESDSRIADNRIYSEHKQRSRRR